MSSKEALVCLRSRSGRWAFNNTQKEKHKWYEDWFSLTALASAQLLCRQAAGGAAAGTALALIPPFGNLKLYLGLS
jgi:hypothetical protein